VAGGLGRALERSREAKGGGHDHSRETGKGGGPSGIGGTQPSFIREKTGREGEAPGLVRPNPSQALRGTSRRHIRMKMYMYTLAIPRN